MIRKRKKIVSVCKNTGNFLRLLQKGKNATISHISIINVGCFVSLFIFKRNKIEFKSISSLSNDHNSTNKSRKYCEKSSQEWIKCLWKRLWKWGFFETKGTVTVNQQNHGGTRWNHILDTYPQMERSTWTLSLKTCWLKWQEGPTTSFLRLLSLEKPGTLHWQFSEAASRCFCTGASAASFLWRQTQPRNRSL